RHYTATWAVPRRSALRFCLFAAPPPTELSPLSLHDALPIWFGSGATDHRDPRRPESGRIDRLGGLRAESRPADHLAPPVRGHDVDRERSARPRRASR